MKSKLQELSIKELNDLFLEASNSFLKLLNEDPNSPELPLVKQKVKAILDALEQKDMPKKKAK